ncbi:MAG: hypothetical protein ACE5Q6_07735, partial [Dehalococcoidia bacterium]
DRETPSTELVAQYQEGERSSVIVQPGDFYLIKTIERVNTPEYLTVNIKPRTTTFRSGLFIRTGNVAPGYRGELIFAMKNEGPCVVEMELGARVVHAQWHLVEGASNTYRGQWQHGRVTTTTRESQI